MGNAANNRQQNVVVNEGTTDHEFSVSNTGISLTTNEILVDMQAFERCFNEKIDRQTGNIVDTVEERIQKTILTPIDKIITPRI